MPVQHRERNSGKTTTHSSLGIALNTDLSKETWLVMCPHDDDGNIGAGLAIATATQEGATVHICVVTNGVQGYCDLAQKNEIVKIRQAETVAAYAALGIPEEQIHCLGYADGTTYQNIGVRAAQPGEPSVQGKTGLEASFTEIIRRLAPQRILTPASTDLHPDHKAVYKDLLISIFHASGDIWPELGEPIALPEVYEFPIYTALEAAPDFMLTADAEIFQKKLASIACFASQKQISQLVDKLRAAGPVEFLSNIKFSLYDPAVYQDLFA